MLDDAGRIAEVARLLSGNSEDPQSRVLAEKLIRERK